LLTNVLPVDYLTPDVAHAVPELAALEDAQADPAPSAMARSSSPGGPVVADGRPSRVHRAAATGEVMPWHFLGIPLGTSRA
jgi:hypothetical protein